MWAEYWLFPGPAIPHIARGLSSPLSPESPSLEEQYMIDPWRDQLESRSTVHLIPELLCGTEVNDIVI